MPLLLGGGKSLFPADGVLRTLEPVSTTSPPHGANVCVYRRPETR
ncbi:hypothetical protein ACIGW0_06800 [Streptomyces bikiniensis]|uniref:Bacterial bifunctional deaminase-reductase C-terminal domain-containing protein n=1 Tax=Streptomyces bikiniensis TaxID=1896 RepID=A0ABW8CNJ4_STRBI